MSQNKGTKADPKTSYLQQYDAMRMTGATTPDPKNQVLKDITAVIRE